ncbi:protein kinase domain-containing protein [Sorangium sp. So ce542]|uniref:protein kinase domain-containing protein n=1 Tax=Sorangium sp. So ce542 TaxID=3133316 RepID=UPI003F6428E8
MARSREPVLSTGEIFQGRYEIGSPLGEGGFGTVYKAWQLATRQAVAIKVLQLGPQDGSPVDKRQARFHREMWLCGRLHHPNIVRLIDFGRADEDIAYSVFEFVPGKNLSAVLSEEGALEPSEARHLMLQVLDALSCAHTQGIVHRDLKPSNIMVVPTGARRNALVLDFGIGGLTRDARRDGYATLTATHEMLCTPAYAAPEQFLGAEPTPRTDLYSWGLVFLECLTGARVITGNELYQIIYRQAGPEPIPIPAALCNHPLGRLLGAATHKDVAARVVTAEGLFRELERCDLTGLRRGIESRGAHSSSPRAAEPDAHTRAAAEVATHAVRGAQGRAGAEQGRPERASAPGEPPSEGERRRLTAVCCALTVLGGYRGAADAEELDDLLQAQQAICGDVARRFQGHVASALGDWVLLCFGHPVAREDDALRAARAALEIAAEIEKQSTRLAIERGVSIEVRIGVHTGRMARDLCATAGQTLGPMLGRTPELAARLSVLAPPGAIVTSGETYRLLREQFHLSVEGAYALDPSAQPVEIYRLQRPA